MIFEYIYEAKEEKDFTHPSPATSTTESHNVHSVMPSNSIYDRDQVELPAKYGRASKPETKQSCCKLTC